MITVTKPSPLPYRRTDKFWWWADYKYKLTRNWVGTFEGRLAPRAFRNEWIEILPLPSTNQTQITMFSPYAWDGATAVRDCGGWKMALSSIFHDGIFQFTKAIADAWGWTIPEVLDFANDIFHEAMQQVDSCVQTVFWRSVQVVGTPFWYLAHWSEWSFWRKHKSQART